MNTGKPCGYPVHRDECHWKNPLEGEPASTHFVIHPLLPPQGGLGTAIFPPLLKSRGGHWSQSLFSGNEMVLGFLVRSQEENTEHHPNPHFLFLFKTGPRKPSPLQLRILLSGWEWVQHWGMGRVYDLIQRLH